MGRPSLEHSGIRDAISPARQRSRRPFIDVVAPDIVTATSSHGGTPLSSDPPHRLADPESELLDQRRARVSPDLSPFMMLLTVIAAIGVLLYASFLLNPNNRGDGLPYAMVITAEAVLILQALLAMWTILSGAAGARDYAYYAARDALFDPRWAAKSGDDETWPLRLNGREVSVDAFITVYGEPLETIRRTATAV